MTAVIKCISGLFPGKKTKKNRKKKPKPQTQNKTKKPPPHALQPTNKKMPIFCYCRVSIYYSYLDKSITVQHDYLFPSSRGNLRHSFSPHSPSGSYDSLSCATAAGLQESPAIRPARHCGLREKRKYSQIYKCLIQISDAVPRTRFLPANLGADTGAQTQD